MLELRAQAGEEENGVPSNGGNIHLSRPKVKLPNFKPGSDRIEFFIERFEQAADALEYDEITKRLQFVTLFEGKPLEIIHRLDQDNRSYRGMKDALLAAYGLSAEKLKDQFFTASIGSNETASQFASRLEAYLRDWQEKDGAENTIEGIKDLFLRAQFVKSCPEDLVARLKIDKVGKLKKMSEVADAYFEAHEGKRIKSVKDRPVQPHTEVKSESNSTKPPPVGVAKEKGLLLPPQYNYRDRPHYPRYNYPDRLPRRRESRPRYEGRRNEPWQGCAGEYQTAAGPNRNSWNTGYQAQGIEDRGGNHPREYRREVGGGAL